MDWPIIFGGVGVLASLIVGIGGLIKNRADARVGLRADTREELTLFEARYQAILDEVRESLVDPLRLEVERLRGELDLLREELAAERAAGKLRSEERRVGNARRAEAGGAACTASGSAESGDGT